MLYYIGFDPHRDGPVEPLHTVLLGVVKYTWALTMSEISSEHKIRDLQARLQSIVVDGMNIDPIRAAYIVQYKGSLIGRQFKSILQVISFTLHGLVADSMRNLWVALGNMVSLLWFPEIDDIEEYSVRSSLNLYEAYTYCYITLRMSYTVLLRTFWTGSLKSMQARLYRSQSVTY